MIKKIIIKNFMPFQGEYEINLSSGVTNIIGEWEGEQERSNRAGKSSIVDSIIYALYGKGRTKSEYDLINNNSDKMLVSLLIEGNDGREVTVQRGRYNDRTKKAIFNVRGLERNSDLTLQQDLEDWLGLEYKDFLLTCCFAQNDINSFMNMSQAEKKTKLSSWLQTIEWSSYEQKIKDLISEEKNQIKSLEKINDSLFIELQNIQLLDKKEIIGLKKFKNYEIKIKKEFENELKKIEKEKFELEKDKQELNNLRSNLKKSKISLEDLNKRIEIQSTLEKNLKKYENELKINKKNIDELGISDEAYNSCKDKESIIKSEIKDLDRKIYGIKQEKNKLNTILNDNNKICPILNIECEDISNKSLKENLNSLNDLLEKLEKKLERKEGFYKELKEDIKQYETYVEIKRNTKEKIKNLECFLEDVDFLKNMRKECLIEIKDTQEKLEDYKNLAEDLEFISEEIAELEGKILTCNTNIKTYDKSFVEQETKEDLKEKIEETIEKNIEELKELKAKTEIYDYLLCMFGKDGLPLLEINNNLFELETNINFILNRLNTNMSVSINTEQEILSYETQCFGCGYRYKGVRDKECPECKELRKKKTKNDIQIKIYHKEKETLFELDSGGGKALISIAIRLAITKILRSRGKINCNFLILDEIFGSLDIINRESVLKLFLDILKEDFKQIFSITHTKFYDILSNDIFVIKKKDYSEIEVTY